jgi:hypothetical protein
VLLLALLEAGCASPRMKLPASAPGAVSGAPGRADVYSMDAGFVASADTDLRGNQRVRALGPLIEKRTAPDGKRFLAVRPFYSKADGPETDRTVHEALWPVFSLKNSGREQDWRCLLVFGHDFDRFTPHSRYWVWGFPILFTGRDKHGESYFAIFPLGGSIHEFLMRDKIIFALFPLYAYSTFNEQKTHSVLWPVGSYTRGPGVLRYRVFPVYGKSTYKDHWTKSFVMWPTWTTVQYGYKSSQGNGYMLFPVVSHVKLTDQETWMVVPPFFRWSTSSKQTKVHAPWPFVQSGSGETDKLYLWPAWGHKREGSTRSWFALWPIMSSQVTEYPDSVLHRFRVLPLLEYESRTPVAIGSPNAAGQEAKPDVPVRERYVKLWPLLSYAREGSNSVTRVADLWPLKPAPQIEKNYAPLWTFYSWERSGNAHQHELLWGLFRQGSDGVSLRNLSLFPLFSLSREPAAGRSRFSCLLGLCRVDRKGLEREWRLLYFLRFGTRGTPREPGESVQP